ncbi:rhomboid family intramembrane serine protease [Variovorax sp. VNK109]|uniref:rhomboid family intramembrane serine protease n=1 Tax=Variovorax sp. VNK109 TaxID=3400919 RepID=UPI003C00813E
MSNDFDSGSGRLEFRSSGNSPIRKARLYAWLGGIIGVGISAALTRNLTALAVPLVVIAVLDFVLLRRLAATNQLAAVLDGNGIESPHFTGKTRRFAWSEIESVSVRSVQGSNHLELLLKPAPGRQDKRSFLTGRNSARVSLPLGMLDSESQERLVDAVHDFLRAQRTAAEDEPVNLIREQRALQEHLASNARHPWVTYVLAVLNIGIWLMIAAPGQLMGNLSPDVLFAWGGNAASEVQKGVWWRLVSCTFLHVNLMHLATNMVGLLAIGSMLERMYGHWLFLLIYIGSGLLGSVASLHFVASNAVGVGASGAVFGIMGALMVGVFVYSRQMPRAFGKQSIAGALPFVGLSLVQGFATPGVDNAAHVGGLVAGVAIAALLPVRANADRFRQLASLRSALAIAMVAVVAFAGTTLSPKAPYDLHAALVAGKRLEAATREFGAVWKGVEDDSKSVKAGTLSELQMDERSRTVHAPRMHEVLRLLDGATMPAGHPFAQFSADFARFVTLLHEMLAMPSVVVNGRPVPVDMARTRAIEKELGVLNARIVEQSGKFKARKKP